MSYFWFSLWWDTTKPVTVTERTKMIAFRKFLISLLVTFALFHCAISARANSRSSTTPAKKGIPNNFPPRPGPAPNPKAACSQRFKNKVLGCQSDECSFCSQVAKGLYFRIKGYCMNFGKTCQCLRTMAVTDICTDPKCSLSVSWGQQEPLRHDTMS